MVLLGTTITCKEGEEEAMEMVAALNFDMYLDMEELFSVP
jgi:hypothetical protein